VKAVASMPGVKISSEIMFECDNDIVPYLDLTTADIMFCVDINIYGSILKFGHYNY
jgi:hypothetical protein